MYMHGIDSILDGPEALVRIGPPHLLWIAVSRVRNLQERSGRGEFIRSIGLLASDLEEACIIQGFFGTWAGGDIKEPRMMLIQMICHSAERLLLVILPHTIKRAARCRPCIESTLRHLREYQLEPNISPLINCEFAGAASSRISRPAC
jgi:hypothetical protein